MKEEVPTLRKTKCIRIYNIDNHYYFYILGMHLPCGIRKEAMKQAMGDKAMEVCWKGTGSTLVYRGKTIQTLQQPACFPLALPKYSVIFW